MSGASHQNRSPARGCVSGKNISAQPCVKVKLFLSSQRMPERCAAVFWLCVCTLIWYWPCRTFAFTSFPVIYNTCSVFQRVTNLQSLNQYFFRCCFPWSFSMMGISVSVWIFTLYIPDELLMFPFIQGGESMEGKSVQGQPEGSSCSGWPHPVQQPVPWPPASPAGWAVPEGDSRQGQAGSRIPTHHGEWKSEELYLIKERVNPEVVFELVV